MKRTYSQKGFTLVELAIVMTIIGLLIGGILKGQELMENARLTATVAQVKAYEAATTTFRDSYNAFPGDMPLASNRIPNCPVACNPITGAGNAGNAQIGDPAYQTTLAVQLPAAGMTVPPAAVGDETQLYWIHLLQTDLITGITDAAIRNQTVPSWGVTHPNARLSGGFVVGYGNGQPGLGMPAATIGPAGTILVLQPQPNTTPAAVAGGLAAVSPARAGQIDRKMDDGKPTAGFVQAWGLAGAGAGGADVCVNNTPTPPDYAEGNSRKTCGLIFRIQG